jgi:hypothetical protein
MPSFSGERNKIIKSLSSVADDLRLIISWAPSFMSSFMHGLLKYSLPVIFMSIFF